MIEGLITPEDFEKGAVPDDTIEKIHEEMIEEEMKRIYSFPPGYLSRLRRDKNWSMLNQQIVGSGLYLM